MKQDVIIKIYEVVGNPLCVASSDGQKVYDRLAAALKEKQRVIISFNNITMLTSAFLNAAIGQLYGAFDPELIRSSLEVVDIKPEDKELLRRVVETAKQYFSDPKKFDETFSDVLKNDDDDF